MRSRSASASAGSSAASVTAVGRPGATSWAKVGPGQHRDRRSRGRPRARPRGAACRCASSMPFEQRTSGLPRARRLLEHGAHVLRRRDHQPGVAAIELAQDRRSRGSRDRAVCPAGRRGFSWRCIDRVDDFGLERPQQGLAPAGRRDLRQRGAPGAAADHRRCFMPSPPRRAPSRRCRRAASAPAPERRARRSARRRSARPRPRRSSPHCRCTARPAGR